jgi:hypothetical protein|tara:strand:+ start:333 stop:542 length:210 start_codon:yes stop_codon:yes gene_type:complete
MEDNIHIARIATALEKIAELMKNAESREVNMLKKANIAESKSIKAKSKQQLMEAKMEAIKSRNANKKKA